MEKKKVIDLGFGVYLRPIESKFFSGETYKDYEIINKQRK